MNKETIKKILTDDLGVQNIKSIKNSSTGLDQEVYVVSSVLHKYVFKIIKDGNKNVIYNIKFIYKRCLSLGLKIPKIIYSKDSYTVETFIQGCSMDKVKLSKKEYQRVYSEVGKFLRKLHSFKSRGYTQFGSKIKMESHSNPKKQITQEFKKNLKFLSLSGLIDPVFIKRAEEYFFKNNSFLSKDLFALSHDDLSENHIYIFKKEFNGIIDFADGGFKHPASEFRHLFFKLQNNYKFQALMEGYGKKIDFKKIEFFIFLDCLWRIPLYYREKKYKSYSENKKYFLKIVSAVDINSSVILFS